MLPDAALAVLLAAGPWAAARCAAGLWADLAAALLAEPVGEFVPGPAPIFGWPVPVLETVVTG